MKTKIFFLGMASIIISCTSSNKNAGNNQKVTSDSAVNLATEVVKAPAVNIDSLVTVIDAERDRIETNLKSFRKTTLSSKELRAQIKQKWAKFDFYTEKGQVVRIKSYPYEKISQRTEEFYFRNGNLILAFIEDEGLKTTGKGENRFGKTYYFYNDAQIKEVNPTAEKETAIRTSDGERLLQEAKEYLELVPKK